MIRPNRTPRAAVPVREKMAEPRQDFHRSRFQAAKTSRLNQTHWSSTSPSSINDALAGGDLATIRERCIFEFSNNPNIEGMVEQYAVDLVGKFGPSLQVQSENPAFNESLESSWKNWWAMPDAQNRLSGPDMLKLMVRMFFQCGENVIQKANIADAPGPVSFRLKNIHPRRLDTPFDKAGSADIILGVELDSIGRPARYYISVEELVNGISLASTTSLALDASNIIHLFIQKEPDQVRGLPWLTTPLSTAADLRDYESQVMDAARIAADNAGYLYTDRMDAPFVEVAGSVDIEPRTINTLPPGYRMEQLNPRQPSAQYKDFRDEKLEELGAPVGMPLMKIKRNASGHNYSSARFDAQGFNMAINSLEGYLERNLLAECVGQVARELQLAPTGQRLGPVPMDTKLVWTWPQPPHVDPVKEANAAGIRIDNQISTITDELAGQGKTLEEYIDKRRRELDALDAAGLNQDQSAADIQAADFNDDEGDEDEPPRRKIQAI